MPEQSQPTPIEHFPHFQRVLIFLANCGLHSYGLHFTWFDQQRHLFYPFTHRYHKYHGGWFEASDEAKLYQQEQASIDGNILVGKIFADSIVYSLELDRGHYQLSYSLTSTGRQQLIRDLLAEKGITQYELIDEVSEGRRLPPYQGFAKVEDCSGTVVTPTSVYGFWLSWANGRYTLGEEQSYWLNGEEHSFWHEYTPEEIRPHGKFPGFEREVEGARRRLHLRRHAGVSASDEKSEAWKLREEEANHFSA
jgi:hypothetical protein